VDVENARDAVEGEGERATSNCIAETWLSSS